MAPLHCRYEHKRWDFKKYSLPVLPPCYPMQTPDERFPLVPKLWVACSSHAGDAKTGVLCSKRHKHYCCRITTLDRRLVR